MSRAAPSHVCSTAATTSAPARTVTDHRTLGAFQRALETGDLQSLLDLLAPDVVALSDGGGVKQAMPRPTVGAEKVARLLAAGVAVFGLRRPVEAAQVNGHPALIVRIDGEIDMVVALRIDDGLVTGLYSCLLYT